MTARSAAVATLIAILALCQGCGEGTGPTDVQGLLAQGWQSYAMGDFDFARNSFSTVEAREGLTDAERFSCLLGLATTYHMSTSPDLDKAAEYYGQLEGLGTDEARQQSLLGLALIDLAQGRHADGQAGLTRLIEEFPDSTLADEAAVHLADSLLSPKHGEGTGVYVLPRAAEIDRGVRILEGRLSSHPDSPLAAQMHIMVGNVYIDREEFQKAIDHLIAAEEFGIDVSRTRSIVLWQIARIAEKKLEDYELAERYYALYVQDFPHTTLFYRASKSLDRVRDLKQEAEG